MKKLVAMAVATVALVVLGGCSDSVSTVKDGTMEAYPQGTIGDVFTANFDDGKWTAEKKDGKEYVTFTGKISQKLHDRAYSKIKLFAPLYEKSSYALSKELRGNLDAVAINEKFAMAAAEKAGDYYKASEIRIEIEKQENDRQRELILKLAHKYWWPVGSGVEFSWIVYPDGKKFEIESVSSNSWSEYGLNITDVFNTLYGQ